MTGVGAPVLFDLGPATADFAREVREGLGARPKRLSPKWFYDELGSRLFEAICALPEYYPTRTELSLFDAHAAEMAAAAGPDRVLVELGSGAGEKVRRLMAALRPSAYVAVDISADALARSTASLAEEFPDLPVFGVCTDFAAGLALPPGVPPGPRLFFYPGSSIGNFAPEEAVALLRPLAAPGAALLIGVDLPKDADVLEAAYDDPLGVTAAFNLNLLARINRELGADLDLRAFRHVAFFEATESRIEMHLESRVAQRVRVGGRVIGFEAGERIHTENSYKYPVDAFTALAARAGWRPRAAWTDPRGWFAELLFEA
jgi:dimethylhistidine N-methyltransferase